jgi:hypothetical protein
VSSMRGEASVSGVWSSQCREPEAFGDLEWVLRLSLRLTLPVAFKFPLLPLVLVLVLLLLTSLR